MASEPLYAIILLGLGINTFSMNPFFIPLVKKVLRQVKMEKAKEILENALELPPEEMEKFILNEINSNFGEILQGI